MPLPFHCIKASKLICYKSKFFTLRQGSSQIKHLTNPSLLSILSPKYTVKSTTKINLHNLYQASLLFMLYSTLKNKSHFTCPQLIWHWHHLKNTQFLKKTNTSTITSNLRQKNWITLEEILLRESRKKIT